MPLKIEKNIVVEKHTYRILEVKKTWPIDGDPEGGTASHYVVEDDWHPGTLGIFTSYQHATLFVAALAIIKGVSTTRLPMSETRADDTAGRIYAVQRCIARTP